MRAALDEQLSILLQALSDDVYKWPLRVALEKMCPDLEDGQTQGGRVPVCLDIKLAVAVFEVDDVVRLFYNTPNPMQDPVLAVYWLVVR